MAIAGRVAIVPKGEWSQSVTYDKLDLVTYNGNTFIAYKSSVGVTPVDGDTWMLIIEGVDPQDIDNIINGTTPVAKAKDADTVDDYHASDFILGSPSKSNITSTFTFQNLMHKCETEKRAIFFTNWTDGKNFPYVYGSGIVIPAYDARFYLILYGRTASDETSSKFATATVMRSNDVYTAIWDEKANKDEVLPLTGGTLSGDLIAGDNNTTSFCAFKVRRKIGENVYRANFGINSNYSLALEWINDTASEILNRLEIFSSKATLNGKDILHTGNSQKVTSSTSAPSDTSALWVDTTNKKVKAYIDGAWTAMA